MPITSIIVGAGLASAGLLTNSVVRDAVYDKKKRAQAFKVMAELGPIFLSEGMTVNDLWYVFENQLKQRKLSRRRVRKYPQDKWDLLLTEMQFTRTQQYLLTRTWRDEKKNRFLRVAPYTDPNTIDLVRGIGPVKPGSHHAPTPLRATLSAPPSSAASRVGPPVRTSDPCAPPSRSRHTAPRGVPIPPVPEDADSDIASEGDSDWGAAPAPRTYGGTAVSSTAPAVQVRADHLPPTVMNAPSEQFMPGRRAVPEPADDW